MGSIGQGDLGQWVREMVLGKGPDVPFSFHYDTCSSRELLRTWEQRADSERLDDQRTLHVLASRDPETRVEVRCETIEYLDFPALEWVVRFKNGGDADTPVLKDIRPLDMEWDPGREGDLWLHHLRGSLAIREDFSPVETPLTKLSHRKFGCLHAESACLGDFPHDKSSLPFFTLAFDGGGVILAIGWCGTWVADFKRDDRGVLALQAGMEHTRLKLLANEQIRTPRILMFFWTGERIDAHNAFRRFILAHHTPHENGRPVELPLSASSWFVHDLGSGVTEGNQMGLVREYARHNLSPECLWIDAGWCEGVEGVERWGETVGNWFPKRRAFPRGLKPVCDEAGKHGMGLSLWFEPERAKPGSELYREHLEWMLMPDEEIARKRRAVFSVIQPWTTKVEALLDFGNPQARRWITDRVSAVIEEVGVTIYRQDFNMEPLDYWRAADRADRQAMTEIRYVEGMYEFWDELLRRHPGLIIDSDKASGRCISLNGCASVDRRIDIETMSRSVALYRSDWVFDPEGAQSHTMGIHCYYPCNATTCNSTDPYVFRSCLAAGMLLAWDVSASDFDADEARKRVEEFKIMRPLFYGDFYPLTLHHSGRISDVWCAYQLHREDLNRGAVVAFRRARSPYPVAAFKLHGLEPGGEYELADMDTGVAVVRAGEELLSKGLEISMHEAPHASIVLYGSCENG